MEYFTRTLFQLNCAENPNNYVLDVNICNCPFADEGPHRYVRLGLGATTIILTLIEHGFTIAHDNHHRHHDQSPLRCVRSMVCECCNVRLCDTNSLLLILGQRNEIIGHMLQSDNAKRITAGPLPLVNFMHHSSNLFSLLRENIDRMLYDMHEDTCFYRETVYFPNMIDQLTANRLINCILRHRCETCLFTMVENDVYLELTLDRFETIPTNGDNDTANKMSIDATCRCCFERRAQVNVPCGHVFQCKNCMIQMKQTLLNNRSLVGLVYNPPCSVCRAPVMMSLNLYD